jgi:hypothetical protein
MAQGSDEESGGKSGQEWKRLSLAAPQAQDLEVALRYYTIVQNWTKQLTCLAQRQDLGLGGEPSAFTSQKPET